MECDAMSLTCVMFVVVAAGLVFVFVRGISQGQTLITDQLGFNGGGDLSAKISDNTGFLPRKTCSNVRDRGCNVVTGVRVQGQHDKIEARST